MCATQLPCLTQNLPGIGGTLKNRPEDFFVQEIPAYEPAGVGEHVFCEIEKKGLTTFDAVDRLAKSLRVHPKDIGYAGMKDAQAITRQIFSIWGVTPEAVMNANIPGLRIQWATRHINKLRLGHLRANRFIIKIRDVNPTDVVKLTPIVKQLQERGMPNYFGEQRFGRRGNNHLLGAALIRGDDAGVLKLLLGAPDRKIDDARQIGARKAFDAGDLATSMRLWPRNSGMERRVLARLIKTGKPPAAVRVVDERIQRLWVSALQSEVFNQTVAARIQSLDRLIPGDLAQKHDSGGVFLIEDPAAEQERCDRFEISPTGPLVGYRMTLPGADALQLEESIFAANELKPSDFRVEGKHKVKGARRPLRVKPEELQLTAGVDEHGPHITATFTLPPGSFATVLLREFMKTDLDD
jgi:tRNA pseudouridine13 synthase